VSGSVDPDAPVTIEERQAVSRLLTLLLVGALAVVVAAGVVAFTRDDDVTTIADRGGIGPLPGADIVTFVERRKVALDKADGRRAAVVSFASYRTEAEARAGLGDLEVEALLVAAPGGTPTAVRGSLEQWATRERQAAAEERANLQGMMDTEDPEFKRQFEQDMDRLTRLERAVAPGGPVVFGALVVGEADALRQLGQRPDVRLVDVDNSDDVPEPADVRGIRPEETTTANEPINRPV
jgi:hypothetical protein